MGLGMDGIINVHKGKGYTSHDVVAKLRGILHQKKIGHTGTLDPDATGVLPVCLGRATKVCELLTDKQKTYVARVRLGAVTDTQDMTGTVLEEHPVDVTKEEIHRVVSAFSGEIWQTPPMYSAVKVNGRRLYELARQGVDVERKKRKITVYSIEMTEFFPETSEFVMEVTCSKGTYIRTLCHDIGRRLGCGAAMAGLVRTGVGPFVLEDSFTLGVIEERVKAGGLEQIVMPVDRLFKSYPEVVVSDSGIRFLQNGNTVKCGLCVNPPRVDTGQKVRMYDGGHNFYAIYQYDDEARVFTNVKMFYSTAGQ